ncbi:FERM and PDZ domain-containing protein 2 [Armadillidium nasatum]|uniref:FERM and PDZ domain-containing protein 2 n=1 Tax=Armadillidium nasatum TaxID=96803 RepID=A0A5N5SZ69_9CRUS|nr:FERM and PDZ domain-containing protein 2 [Armadillidium nasatum]
MPSKNCFKSVVRRWNLFTLRRNLKKGDCVSEILSNSGPTILTSSGGGNDRYEVGEVTSLSSTNSNFYKSSHIERKKEVMLVTNEPISATHMALPCSHYTNNNNILNTGINDSYHQRAAKYFIENSPPPTSQPPLMVKPCDDLVVGDSVYGQDNLGFDSSFNFIPYGEIRSLDPGYGSERSDNGDGDEDIGDDDDRSYSSEEEECSPNNRHSYIEASQEGIRLDVEYLMKIFPFINESTLFDITVFKNSRGLGLAVTGGIECDTGVLPGLIRIRKIYPQTPAWLCGQLQEALEVLRVAGNEVNLVVCRAPEEVLNGKNDLSPEDVNDQGIVSTSLTCPQTLSGSHLLSPSPSSYSMCGEFEIAMKKVAGSLGFTLRKNDNSILGHTIRSLVKEPAISDGRLRPGDKLLSVNGTDMCGLSHEEAVQFLRTCPETVAIRIYRDAIQTPVSPASPTELEPSKPKALRKEARDMLTDLAFKKQSSPNLAESDLPSTSRRRRLKNSNNPGGSKAERWESLVRKAEEESNDLNKREVSPFDNSNSDTLTANSSPSGTVVSCSSSGNSFKEISRPSSPTFIINPLNSENKPRRPDFLDLTNSYSSKKSQFTPPHEDSFIPSPAVTQFSSLESAPQITSAQSDTPAFTHLQSCYRSVNVGSSSVSPFSEQRLTNTSSDHNICHEEEYKSKQNALIKWKGVVFTPEAEKSETSLPDVEEFFTEQESGILTIEMTRGWNSRLGFSLQNGANGTDTEIVAIYEDSLAARDGRLKVGDVILEVNEHDVREWKTQDVIDLLRKTRGRIVFKILQKENIDS